ncbi:MAG: hypothetical protein LC722_06090 [Actinobacteria bacterium]|nr:hypothetical protein [Actinomycetota bacterium]
MELLDRAPVLVVRDGREAEVDPDAVVRGDVLRVHRCCGDRGRGALVQQVNAVESVSNVDVVCTDKTGTLTTVALAASLPGSAWAVREEVPFASSLRWSGVRTDEGTWVLGAPDALAAPLAGLAPDNVVAERAVEGSFAALLPAQREGRRMINGITVDHVRRPDTGLHPGPGDSLR